MRSDTVQTTTSPLLPDLQEESDRRSSPQQAGIRRLRKIIRGWLRPGRSVKGAPGPVKALEESPLRHGFTPTGEKIAEVDVLADPACLRQLDLAVLNGSQSAVDSREVEGRSHPADRRLHGAPA